jgi:flagellar hook assembly protein FlgD
LITLKLQIPRTKSQINSKSQIELKIYDVSGRLVKDFSRLTLDALRPTLLSWDGMDDNNRRVAEGVYFVRLVVDRAGQENYQKTEKIIFLK